MESEKINQTLFDRSYHRYTVIRQSPSSLKVISHNIELKLNLKNAIKEPHKGVEQVSR